MQPLPLYREQALRELRESNAPKLFSIAEKIAAVTEKIDLTRAIGANNGAAK